MVKKRVLTREVGDTEEKTHHRDPEECHRFGLSGEKEDPGVVRAHQRKGRANGRKNNRTDTGTGITKV